ncbi:unnamed protein product [Nezara viridula]|uniref:Zinc finger protein basonuclin-2 n=1 Tax=Nezara viridula TaxID=85310 RepID=A0A9P0HV14_NEZVI|nr:unnamed protein product [Nezara viridula]
MVMGLGATCPEALDKLGFRHVLGQTSVEPVQVNVAFDIASLVLYGCQALPIRLKILLDRLFSVLQREEVVQVLRGFGWTQEDYARGYILQLGPLPPEDGVCSSLRGVLDLSLPSVQVGPGGSLAQTSRLGPPISHLPDDNNHPEEWGK